jgi:hypothetical protein
MTEATEPYVDFWDNHRDTHFLPLPARTLSQAVSGECETLTITKGTYEGKDAWWLSDPATNGEAPYESLLEAKKAGDAISEKDMADQPAVIAQHSGLDPAAWLFKEIDGSPTFHLVADPETVMAYKHSRDGGQWELIPCGTFPGEPMPAYPTPAAAAEAYAFVPPFGL